MGGACVIYGGQYNPSADGRIILKWILKTYNWMERSRFICFGQEQFVGFCEHGKEHSGSIKCGQYLD
jgi:hypothetical protein